MGSYLVVVSEHCISERIIRVSLDLDDAILDDWLILRRSIIFEMFRTANPKDYRNV